jgi:hypothetical protein
VARVQGRPRRPLQPQEEEILDEADDLSPKELRRRQQRGLRLDHILRKVHAGGVEILDEVDLEFLEDAAAELRSEFGWKDE